MSDNTDMPFEYDTQQQEDCGGSHYLKYGRPAAYRPKRPKQQVYLFDGSDQSAIKLNELLDKGWRLTQQLEPQVGLTSRSERRLYLLELEGE